MYESQIYHISHPRNKEITSGCKEKQINIYRGNLVEEVELSRGLSINKIKDPDKKQL